VSPARYLLLIPALYVLFFFRIDGVGMVGPDEPRYAAIGREMAHSGDWVTPRLWGKPWFEKSPLLYWMTGAGFLLGLGDETAPRIPVAVLSVAFLGFYFRILRRLFDERAAAYATAILAVSPVWLVYSNFALTDLPMTAGFAAAMLLILEWLEKDEGRMPLAAGFLLGIAVLAKGLVPLALAAPLAWYARKRIVRALPAAGVFLLTAAPWYILCEMRNGRVFFDEFILKHHISRFLSPELQHVRPWWWYLPVAAGLLFPFTPAIALWCRRRIWDEPRTQFLLVWFLFGFVFLSYSTNKLPGYLLPLAPAACALIGVTLRRERMAKPVLALSALLLTLLPSAVAVLPDALADGLSRTNWKQFHWEFAAAAAIVAAICAFLPRNFVVLVLVACMVVTVGYVKFWEYPAIDYTVSARASARQIVRGGKTECVPASLNRAQVYGLNYYLRTPVMPCPD
jgi:4-amino-4-deoxy-L-arabinose transferase-like glycosyltransferase